MPDKSFKIGEEVFDIPENEVGGFLKDNPDATEVVSYVMEKDTFDVPINEANDFLQQNPNAKELKKKDQLEVPLPGLGKVSLPVQQGSKPVSEGVSNPFKSLPVIGKSLDQKLPSDLSTSESVDIESELPRTEQPKEKAEGYSIADFYSKQLKKIAPVVKEPEPTTNVGAYQVVVSDDKTQPSSYVSETSRGDDYIKRDLLKQESAKLNEQGKLAKQDFEVSQKNYYDLKQVVDSYEDIATNPMYEGSAYKEEAMSVLNNLAPAYQAAAAKSNQDASVINGFVETLAAKNDELDTIAERQASYSEGAIGAINTGVADMFDSFSGINKFADKYLFGGMFTDENADDGYAKVANAIRDGSASLEKMPDNLAGDVLGGIAGTLPLIGQTILAPESLGPKLSSTLAFNHFGKTYKETGDVLESVASGVGGWTEGYFMHEIGMGSGKVGELLGKKTGSDVLGKTTGAILSSFGFGGYDFANQYLANFNKPESEQKEIDWRQVASSAGMGLGMSLPSLLHAKAVSDFIDVDIDAAKQSLLIERPLSDIRNSAIEMMEEAPTMRPEEKKNTILLSQGLQRMANVRFVAERLTLDPEYKTAVIKDIKNSETLTPEQKQQQVDKINQFVEETSPIAAEKETINVQISALQEAIEQNNTNTAIGEAERKLNNKTLETETGKKEAEMESLIANDLKTKQDFLEKRREELKQKLNGKESKKSSQEKGSEKNEVLSTPETEGVKEVATTAEPITSSEQTKEVFASDEVKETSPEPLKEEVKNLPDEQFVGKFINSGFLNSVGEVLEKRVDFGMSTKDVKKAINDIKNGKDSAPARQLKERILEIKNSGEVPMMQGTGGKTYKNNIPLSEFNDFLSEFPSELTPSEKATASNLSRNLTDIIDAEGVTLENIDLIIEEKGGFPYATEDLLTIKEYLEHERKQQERASLIEDEAALTQSESVEKTPTKTKSTGERAGTTNAKSTGEAKRVTPESKPLENKKPTESAQPETIYDAQLLYAQKKISLAEMQGHLERIRDRNKKEVQKIGKKIKDAIVPEHTRGTKKKGFFDTEEAIDLTVKALEKAYDKYADIKEAINEAIITIKESAWYKENVGKLFTEKDFDTEFKEYFGEESYRKTQEQKRIEKETGVKKESKTIITDEYTLLKKRLKDQEQGAKYGEKEAKEKAKEKAKENALEIDELRSSAKDLVKNKFKDGELGDLTDGQVKRLLEKMSDIKTEKGLDRFIDYVEKISNKDVVEKDANVDPEIVKEEVKIAKSELEQDYRNLEKVLFGSETPKEYVSGNSPLTLRTGRMQDATLGKLKKYVGNGIDRAVERHLQSQNPYLRNFGQVLNNVLRLGITPERMKAYSKYTGDKQRAIGDAARANETLKKIVGNNKESLSRIHQVLDPEMYLQTRADVLAELKAEIGEVDFSKMSEADKNKQYENYIESIKEVPELTYEDLTPEEKRLHDVLKQVNDITHKINFSLGKIDYGKYMSGKGKYIARMYEAFEMPKDLKEVYESSSKINEGLYKERGGLTDWKLENKIDDPVYLTTKRLYTTLTNKAVSDYAEFISKEKPELVSDIERPGYTKLGKGYGELSDKYVLDSVAEDFKGFFFTTDVIQKSYDLFKAYNKFAPRQFYKKLFTIYNPGTQLGNIMGDNIFGFLVGVDPVTLNKNTYGFALKEVKDYGQTYRYLLGKGLLKSDLTREDLTGSLKNYDDLIEKASKADSPFKYLKEKAQQADGFVNKIYSSVDDLYKIGAFKSLVDKGYTPEAAIKQVENGFQNGNKIPKVYDFASKIPVVGNPFGRWGADLGRIVTNSVSTRPLQTAAFLGSLSFLSYLSSSLSGESEDEKRIRTNRPGAAKIPMPNFLGGDIPLSYKIGENELNVARFLTPLFTYNSPDDDAVSSVFNKFSPLPIEISGRTMNPSGSAAVTIAKNINDPIWTWGQLLVDSDFRGKPILDPNSTIYKQSTLTNKEKTVNAVRFLSQNYIPYFREGASIYDAATGQKDYFGRERDVPQALLRLIGVKIEKYGEEQYTKAFEGSVRSKAYKFMDNSKKASIIRKDLADGKITREVAENRMAPITQEQAKIISDINIEAQAVNNKFSNNLKEEILKDIKGYSNAVDNVGKLEVEPKKKKKWTRVE